MIKRWPLVILLLVLGLTGCGQAAMPSPTREDQGFARFEAELEGLRQALKIPGMSAAIVQDQDLVWAKGFGYADLENRAEATPNTPYRLASLTKPFTAFIVMQLVEEGALSLDDPISKYGLNINGPGVIRVKHLLSMTSEVCQLKRSSDKAVRDVLRQELLSHTMLFAGMGRGEMVPRLLGVYAWVYLPWLFRLVAVWLALVAGSLAFLVWDVAHGTRASWALRAIWGLAILLFGPVGLLAYVLSYRGPQRSPTFARRGLARFSFGSALCSVVGPAVDMFVGFVLRSVFPSLATGAAKLVLVFYGLPFIVGLLALRAPLMASLQGSSYWRGLRRALSAEIISVNAVLLGLFPATVLPGTWLRRLPMPSANEPYHPVLWGVLALGALVGTLTAYLPHLWMVHCNLVPWRALVVGRGEFTPFPHAAKWVARLKTIGAVVLTYALLVGVILVLLPLMG